MHNDLQLPTELHDLALRISAAFADRHTQKEWRHQKEKYFSLCMNILWELIEDKKPKTMQEQEQIIKKYFWNRLVSASRNNRIDCVKIYLKSARKAHQRGTHCVQIEDVMVEDDPKELDDIFKIMSPTEIFVCRKLIEGATKKEIINLVGGQDEQIRAIVAKIETKMLWYQSA